jgi:chloramphenicol 3-O-phosphotransferase
MRDLPVLRLIIHLDRYREGHQRIAEVLDLMRGWDMWFQGVDVGGERRVTVRFERPGAEVSTR